MTLLCCSCSVTEQYDEGHLVSRTVGIGIMHDASCLTGGERSVTEGFGLSFGRNDTVLGYRSADRICLPLESCGAIFFVESDVQAATIHRRFPDLPAPCVIVETPPGEAPG